MSYQERFTQARRDAYWRALGKMRDAQRNGHSRPDQIEFSLGTVAACAALGILAAAGFLVGQVLALLTN